jgi:hypothetical protein
MRSPQKLLLEGVPMETLHIVDEIPGLYRIIELTKLRETPGVRFDVVPLSIFPRIDALDRVIHAHGAISPGRVGQVDRPWYMHPHQTDNLIVLHGARYVEIWIPSHGEIERFTVTPFRIEHNDAVVYDGPALLVWPCGVFHRIKSHETEGSASLNVAVHTDGFDIKTNFNVYDIDLKRETTRVIREGFKDQFGEAGNQA